MEQLIGIDNNVRVEWLLLKATGKPFPVNECALRIWVTTPRGRSEIKSFTITGKDHNLIIFNVNNPHLRFLGGASLKMSILRGGLEIADVEERNAFGISRRSSRGCDCNQVVHLKSYVNILHPEEVPGAVTVLFPTLHVDDNMHLILEGTTDAYDSNFSLEEGHLFFDNNG